MKTEIEQRTMLLNALAEALGEASLSYNHSANKDIAVGYMCASMEYKVGDDTYILNQVMTQHGDDKYLTIVLTKRVVGFFGRVLVCSFVPTEEEDVFEVSMGYQTWIISGDHEEIIKLTQESTGIKL